MRWHRDLFRTYSTTPFSEASVFCFVIFYLAFAIPFYLSFGTESFWMKELTDVYVVQNRYSGFYVAEIRVSDQSVVHVSNVPEIGMSDNNILLEVEGTNYNNKNSIRGSITVNDSRTITSLELYLFFDTDIKSLEKSFTSTVRAVIDFSVGNSVKVMGTLALNLKQPLTLFSSSSSSNQPPYVLNQEYLKKYSTIVENIDKNPQLRATYNTISSQSTATSFELNLFSQGVNEVRYYPSFTQTLRNAFSQYFSLLIVTLFLARLLLRYLANHKVFPLVLEEREFQAMPQAQR